jgi:tetratricopeptide (TPR) repeat protein
VLELDLPSVAASGLPSARRDVVGLPSVGASLPSVSAGLPSPAAALPTTAAGLPDLAIDLPTAASSLPARAGVSEGLEAPGDAFPSDGFGEIDLLGASDDTPTKPGDVFGEIDLPREDPIVPAPIVATMPQAVPQAPPPAPAAPQRGGLEGFGELTLGSDEPPPAPPPSRGPAPGASTPPPPPGAGLGFGEVELGAGEVSMVAATAEPPKPAAAVAGVAMPAVAPAASAAVVRTGTLQHPSEEQPETRRKASPAKIAATTLAVLAILGGAALQLTPYGAFGYLSITDRVRAGDYRRATVQAITDANKTAAADSYEAARAAADGAIASHGRMRRARQLTAYAALVDAALTARFGADSTRGSHAKSLLAELPPDEPVKYADAAKAALAGASEEIDKARASLEAARKKDAGDPAALDEALLKGNLDLLAHDGAAAATAFQQAMALSNDARAHFGLARTAALTGDRAAQGKEIAATLALSPTHPGALIMRARLATGTAGEGAAEKDVTALLAPATAAKLAPGELSAAYAAKAWLLAGRGETTEARDAFAQSLKLDPQSVDALNGQGRLLLNEGRFTEALARFDKALQYDAASPETIANDAEAKLDTDRPADAKAQLLDAKARFPKSVPILLLLGRVQQHLADNNAAEVDFRAACEAVDPAKSDAILPYVALSELYDARGKIDEAMATLKSAKAKLPPSAALERAFGEVAEVQGDTEVALAHYRAALALDPKDAPAHFRLAGLFRKMRKFDDAAAELEKVGAVDKDYPGLSLERGLLYEQAGDVDKAIEQFKVALAKAPDDPDLQLRVGEAYVAIGRADDAIAMLQKVVDKRASSAEAAHYLGRAFMLKTDSTSQMSAMRWLKAAVQLDPNRAEFHVYLAWAATELPSPQWDVAAQEVDKAFAVDKLNPEAYWLRGQLELFQGDSEDALKDERRALELRPARYEAHAVLAQYYEQKNDEAAALLEWPKAIAGDGKPPPDAPVPHPFWLYRYGKLLSIHNNNAGALAQLVPAALAAEKLDSRPNWAVPLEFLTAEALRKAGKGKDAVDHYKRFLEMATANDPDRADAKAALAKLPH